MNLPNIQVLSISFDVNYLPLLILIAAAWLVPMLMSLIRTQRIPTVIVEIIAGYIIGHFIFNHVDQEQLRLLDAFALSGFMFLMFLSGLEINVTEILASLPKRKITVSRFLSNPFLVGVAFFIVSLALSYGFAHGLAQFYPIHNIWYFSLIMVTTSVGIILPVLKNRGETTTRFGQMVMAAAAIADIFSIILFSFTAYIIRNGFRPELLLILGLFLVFYLFYRIGSSLIKIQRFKKLTFQLAHAASQIQIRGALMIILTFIVMSQFIGEEVMLLGAFLSGVLLSIFMNKERSLLLVKLDGIGYGFFIPIFFMMVGARFDASALFTLDNGIVGFLVILLIILFAIKLLPSLLWARLFGLRKAAAGGVLMASRLSLIIAAAQIGLDMQIISPAINTSFILMAIVTCVVAPILYSHLHPNKPFSGSEVIIVGGSSTAVLLARRFSVHGKTAVIIEQDKTRYHDILRKGLNVYHGSGLTPEPYKAIKLTPFKYIVVLTGDEKRDVAVCEFIRREFNHERVITKANSLSIEQRLKELNVEFLDVTRVIASTIENLIVRPEAYHTLIESFDDFSVEEIRVRNRYMEGKALRELDFHKDGSIMLIKRGHQMFIPHGNTAFHTGDVVTILGTDAAVEDFREKFLN
jgi:Kef-type K+ transport system membrane component KefB